MPRSDGPWGKFRVPELQNSLKELPDSEERFGITHVESLSQDVEVKEPQHQQTTTEQRTKGRAPPAASSKADPRQSRRGHTVKTSSRPSKPRPPTLAKTTPGAPRPTIRRQEARPATEAVSSPSPVFSPTSPKPRALPTHAIRVDHRPPTLHSRRYRPILPNALPRSQRGLHDILRDDLVPSDMRLLEQARLLFPLPLQPHAIPSLSSVTCSSFTASYGEGRPLSCLPIPLLPVTHAWPEPSSTPAPARPSLVARQERARHRHFSGPIDRHSRPLDSILEQRHGALDNSTPFLARDFKRHPFHTACRVPECQPCKGIYTPFGPVYTPPDASVYAAQTCARLEGAAWYPKPDVEYPALAQSRAALSPYTAATLLQVDASLRPAPTPPSRGSFLYPPKWHFDPGTPGTPTASVYSTSSAASPVMLPMLSPVTSHSGDSLLGFGGRFEATAGTPELEWMDQATAMTPSISSSYSDGLATPSPFMAPQYDLRHEELPGEDPPIGNNAAAAAVSHNLQPQSWCGAQDLHRRGLYPELAQLDAPRRLTISGYAPQQAKVHTEEPSSGSQFTSSYSSLSGALGPSWSS
ncbi:hypothetical protein GY45DRAFT_195947 [Cubamyces sp. BRFM 1775]|nr:hypothetical protein GY45DRAFT_195947 [Cubamyces sp. BRFM 1775]